MCCLKPDEALNGERNVNQSMEGDRDIINKNGHNTFHTDKPGNFNSLREEISFIL